MLAPAVGRRPRTASDTGAFENGRGKGKILFLAAPQQPRPLLLPLQLPSSPSRPLAHSHPPIFPFAFAFAFASATCICIPSCFSEHPSFSGAALLYTVPAQRSPAGYRDDLPVLYPAQSPSGSRKPLPNLTLAPLPAAPIHRRSPLHFHRTRPVGCILNLTDFCPAYHPHPPALFRLQLALDWPTQTGRID